MKKLLRLAIVGLFLLFTWPWFLLKVYGNKNMQLKGKTIIVCNHYSTFDALFIWFKFWKHKIHFVTIVEARKNPVTRFIVWLFDCIYLKNDLCNLAFFKRSIEILNNNGILCIFPEGYINPKCFGFFDFKASFVLLATKTNSDVLPLYVFPELRLFRKSKLNIGDIISADALRQFPNRDAASMYVQSKIMEMSNEVSGDE